MFHQGHFRLHSQGQENPFKLCLRDKIPESIKPMLTNADVILNKALRDNGAQCCAVPRRRIAGYGRWQADCSVNEDWGCHISNGTWYHHRRQCLSSHFLCDVLFSLSPLTPPPSPCSLPFLPALSSAFLTHSSLSRVLSLLLQTLLLTQQGIVKKVLKH